MNWLITALICIALVELATRLPLGAVMHGYSSIMRKSVHTLQSKYISDHWKEKVMLSYSLSMLCATLKLTGILAAILLLAGVLVYLADAFIAGAAVGEFIISWLGITYSVAAAMLYLKIRKSFV